LVVCTDGPPTTGASTTTSTSHSGDYTMSSSPDAHKGDTSVHHTCRPTDL